MRARCAQLVASLLLALPPAIVSSAQVTPSPADNPCARISTPPAGEPVAAANWISSEPEALLRLFPIAGNTLQIDVRPNDALSVGPVTVVLSVKDEWDGPFRRVCSDTGAAPLTLSATASTGLAHRQWRLEVASPTPAQSLSVSATTGSASTDAVPAEFQRAADRFATNHLVGAQPELICQEHPATRYQAGPERLHPFSEQAILHVAVDESVQTLSTETLEHLALYTVKALATWNAVCANCGVSNLLLLRVGRELYMNSVLASALRQGAPLDALELTIAGLARGTTKNALTYVRLEASDIALLRLCNADSSRLESGLRKIRGVMKCTASTASLDLPIDVTVRVVRQAPIACRIDGKDSTNVIACSRDRTIELDARDFAFEAHGGTRRMFGEGPRQVDLLAVMTHEAGHWLGLAHSDSPSIMSGVLSKAQCVSDLTAGALARPYNPDWWRTAAALMFK